ncbi:hypothetical protein MKW98_016921 [Papaver atlanticum]|uniref:Uncharacterized protein n=1 Tax=Papaver atlanticum TaxID=357466 RepID=A0AAD4TJI8_9MAGN|nr:hypothetical protein MKW98_016921 [Papaver atlanticum]
MDYSFKPQLVFSFATTCIVVALALCLLLMGGFSYSVDAVAGRNDDGEVTTRKVINNECITVLESYCANNRGCATHCRSMKYSGGRCLPNDIDKKPLGICCCLN